MRCVLYILFCLLIAMMGAAQLYAQANYYEEDPKVFSGGLLLGAAATQIDGDSYFGYHKPGFTAGGVVFVHFTPLFGISMELDYIQKGSHGQGITESPLAGTYAAHYFMALHYVEVPLTAHITYHTIDMEAGLAYARLIKAKEWVIADRTVLIDPKVNWFNNTDYNIILGAGRKVYKQLHASLRWQYSLAAVRPAERIPYGYAYGSAGQFNNLFVLRVLYIF